MGPVLMALIRCDFYSEVLEMGTSMTVLLPQNQASRGEPPPPPSGRHPVLYLLHGLSDDDTAWSRQTSLERYVAPLGLAVVMPQAHRSYYTDEAHGAHYWTFLSVELPHVVHRLFPVSTQRDETFIAGISMGGYGALKWALRDVERFAAVASLSGALGLADRLETGGTGQLDPRVRERVFDGRPIGGTPEDVVWLLAQARDASPPLPAIFICCGTEDAFLDENIRFTSSAERTGVELTSSFGPGDHGWGYWDEQLRHVLAWLPLM